MGYVMVLYKLHRSLILNEIRNFYKAYVRKGKEEEVMAYFNAISGHSLGRKQKLFSCLRLKPRCLLNTGQSYYCFSQFAWFLFWNNATDSDECNAR
jgi:hypothetical protein